IRHELHQVGNVLRVVREATARSGPVRRADRAEHDLHALRRRGVDERIDLCDVVVAELPLCGFVRTPANLLPYPAELRICQGAEELALARAVQPEGIDIEAVPVSAITDMEVRVTARQRLPARRAARPLADAVRLRL